MLSPTKPRDGIAGDKERYERDVISHRETPEFWGGVPTQIPLRPPAQSGRVEMPPSSPQVETSPVKGPGRPRKTVT